MESTKQFKRYRTVKKLSCQFVVVVVLHPRETSIHGKHLWSVNLCRLRPPERLTSNLCTYIRQQLATAILESVERETKVSGWVRYQTRDLWLLSQTHYRLRYAAWLSCQFRCQLDSHHKQHILLLTLWSKGYNHWSPIGNHTKASP